MPKISFIDFAKRANARFRLDPVWNNIFKATSRVIDDLVQAPQSDLHSIRDPKRWHRGDLYVVEYENKKYEGVINRVRQREDGVDELYVQLPQGKGTLRIEVQNQKPRQLLIDGAVSKGFNYFSDTLSTSDYQRVNEWIEHFWPESSDDNFVRFIGFVKNIDLSMYQLWSRETEDDSYPVLEREADGQRPVWDSGDYYPTSHVELAYDALNSANPAADLAHLFYLLAPIHLVLERINASIAAETTYTFVGAADLLLTNSAYLRIKD